MYQGYFIFLSFICPCMIFLIMPKRKIFKKKIKRKSEKNQNALIWLQACFLGNVRVIWCNSLGNSLFQTNVIDDVENLFNYYLHITFYVFYILTSCIHYTQIFVKLCTYECVLTDLATRNYTLDSFGYSLFLLKLKTL